VMSIKLYRDLSHGHKSIQYESLNVLHNYMYIYVHMYIFNYTRVWIEMMSLTGLLWEFGWD
jgi:hypothetical protein